MAEATESYERALRYGQQAVQAGQAALGGGQPRGSTQIVITAGGFPGYPDAASEIEQLEAGHWMPSTVDFNQTGADSRGQFFTARRAEEFFGPLMNASGSIGRIAFIGHGYTRGIGLSGDSSGQFSEVVDTTKLAEWQQTIDSQVKPKLGEAAVLDIYACRVGIGEGFQKALAQSLGLCVRAFTEEVAWCIDYNREPKKITSRGRISPRSAVVAGAPCGKPPWRSGVDGLVPPVRVCP
jgi:hypothetical protein